MNFSYKFFPSSKLTYGYNRCIIQDLNRQKIHTIPFDLFNILKLNKGIFTHDQISDLSKTQTGKEYWDFLIKNELVFWIQDSMLENFPDISEEYTSPYDLEYLYLHSDLLEQLHLLEILQELKIDHLILIVEKLSLKNLNEIILKLQLLEGFNTISIKANSCTENKLSLVDQCIVNSIINYAVIEEHPSNTDTDFRGIYFVNRKKLNIWINNTFEFYNLTNNYLSTTFKTLFIGNNFEIKNTYYSKEILSQFAPARLSKEFLLEIIKNISQKNYYSLSRSNIQVCSDCEFKTLCNNREIPKYTEETNIWYLPTECNYNPYISKWEGEEGYLTLKECGVISNSNEFSINHEKIKAINAKLWA